MFQKDSANLIHTVCFDVSIYCLLGEPDVTNERMTSTQIRHIFHTHDARIMMHHASRIRTAHRVDPALGVNNATSTNNQEQAHRTRPKTIRQVFGTSKGL